MRGVVLILFIAISLQLQGADIRNINIFGDSLSASRDRVTSGLVWGEYLTQKYEGSSMDNRAVPGYRTWQILDSIEDFVSGKSGSDDSLHIIWGGTNDIRTLAYNIESGVELLSGLGGDSYIMVSNLHKNPRRVDSFVDLYNADIQKTFTNYSDHLILVDTHLLFQEMYADAASFGLSNVLSDRLHFPTETHQVVADYFYSVVQGVEFAHLLTAVPLSHLSQKIEANSFIFNQFEIDFEKHWIPFIQFSSDSYSWDDVSEDIAPDEDGNGVLLGVLYTLGNGGYVGGALNLGDNSGDFSSQGGTFDLSDRTYTLFGGFVHEKWKVQALVGTHQFDYDELSRSVTLGQLTRIESGSLDGDGTFWSLEGRNNLFEKENLKIGPLIRVTGAEVDTDDYTEDGDFSTSMFVNGASRTSFCTNFGIFAKWEKEVSWGGVAVFSELVIENEHEDNSDTVNVGLKSFAPHTFSLPGFEEDDQGIQFKLSVVADYKKHLSGSIAYINKSGDLLSSDSLYIGIHKKV